MLFDLSRFYSTITSSMSRDPSLATPPTSGLVSVTLGFVVESDCKNQEQLPHFTLTERIVVHEVKAQTASVILLDFLHYLAKSHNHGPNDPFCCTNSIYWVNIRI